MQRQSLNLNEPTAFNFKIMPKILLSHSYFLYLDPKQLEAGNAYPPLGTLYAAALLRENGFSVSLFDSMLASSPERIVPVLESEKPDVLVLYDDGFNYLTKMCLSNMREAAFEMIGSAKKMGCRVIISSSDSTDHFDKYLEKGADFVILGEGEITLLELLKTMELGEDAAGIEGVAFLQNGQSISTGKRPVMKDLNLLPFPSWDLVDVEKYKTLWKSKAGYFSLNMVTTRGCTYKCNWCAKPLFGNRYNARTPHNVVEELEVLVNQFGAEQIWFADDIFGLKPGWIKEFADLVRAKNLKFRFKIQSRADLLVQDDTVKNLARAGCEEVWIGAESGSQKILDAMDKGITLAQIETSRALLKENGIRAAFFIQLGYPGEEKKDIEATINMVQKLLPDEIGVSVSYPLPGTKFYEMVKSQLGPKANWTDSDELAMMFENTYPKGFYKMLQRHLHRVYRKEKCVQSLKNLIHNPQKTSRKELIFAAKAFYWVPISILRQTSLENLISRHGTRRF